MCGFCQFRKKNFYGIILQMAVFQRFVISISPGTFTKLHIIAILGHVTVHNRSFGTRKLCFAEKQCLNFTEHDMGTVPMS